ncbi:MAG: DegT/DnrJ/EryC1/StrS family aminotransferase [Pseudomonadota bacterium]
MKFINLDQQYRKIEKTVKANIDKVLEHGQFILGPEVQLLEQKLADHIGVKHCITVANGSDALLVSMLALDIKAGDEVIVPAFTFIATAEMVSLIGAKPIFIDIDPETYNLDPEKIEAAITAKTKAIMPVSLYGQCADFDAINTIAQQYNLAVIEDGAQSFGATYKGKPSCNLSLIGCTSFFPTKPLACYGDGGACFTNDDDIAEKIRELRVHGQARRYHHTSIGINSRLDTIQAAVLLAKLEIFTQEIERRRENAEIYNQRLKDYVKVPKIRNYNESAFAIYTIETKQRDRLQKTLHERGIPTAVHYPLPLNLQPAFAENHQSLQVPTAQYVAEHVLSLPLDPYFTAAELHQVADAIIEHLSIHASRHSVVA